jgi:hypothetical protein
MGVKMRGRLRPTIRVFLQNLPRLAPMLQDSPGDRLSPNDFLTADTRSGTSQPV